MLTLPEVGFEESVARHNCNVAIAADWIEVSLLAGDEEITQPQVGDVLQEQGIFPRSEDDEIGELCADFLAMVWAELERRAKLLGAVSCFSVEGMRAQRIRTWEAAIPSSFLILLSCATYYPALRRLNRGQYIEQGELFEEMCCLSLNGDGWCATRTGWSSHTGARKLTATVAAAAEALDEPHINDNEVELDRQENEAGCDLVCHLPYRDLWTGRPVVLVQCASGDNFHGKLATPSIDRWRKYIGFSTIPLRGFCTPRAFQREEFRRHCAKVDGLLLDRFRILEPFAHTSTPIPASLAKRLKNWLRPRLKVLPRLK